MFGPMCSQRLRYTGISAPGVDGLPCDDHRHYHGFSGAGGEFERRSADEGIGRFVDALQVAQEPLAVDAPGCRFGEPDEGFHGFDLAEEEADIAEWMVSPVVQEVELPSSSSSQWRLGYS